MTSLVGIQRMCSGNNRALSSNAQGFLLDLINLFSICNGEFIKKSRWSELKERVTINMAEKVF